MFAVQIEVSAQAKALLQTVANLGNWCVSCDLIEPAAELLRAGYVSSQDDYEGPRIAPTKTGEAAALAFGLVTRSSDALYSPFASFYPALDDVLKRWNKTHRKKSREDGSRS